MLIYADFDFILRAGLDSNFDVFLYIFSDSSFVVIYVDFGLILELVLDTFASPKRT